MEKGQIIQPCSQEDSNTDLILRFTGRWEEGTRATVHRATAIARWRRREDIYFLLCSPASRVNLSSGQIDVDRVVCVNKYQTDLSEAWRWIQIRREQEAKPLSFTGVKEKKKTVLKRFSQALSGLERAT